MYNIIQWLGVWNETNLINNGERKKTMKKGHKITFFIAVILIAILGYVTAKGVHFGDVNIKGANEMRYGIDIRGGVEAKYYPKDYEGVPSDAELDTARAIIETRLDAKNITDREVTVNREDGSILVRFPWKSDETEFNPQKAIAELGETAKLTFRDPENNILLEGTDVKKAEGVYDETTGQHVVALELSEEGAVKFETATGNLVGQAMPIYMDETPISAPTVQDKISGGRATITGMESAEAAKDLADKINSGALPFSLESRNYSTISPTMGAGALDVMVQAGLIAFILVCLFMLLYYRLPGFVAIFALTLQVIGMLLALSIPQFTLTLPGIAAVILSIGMGVDANIITSERIKEEINDGKSVKAAIDTGFHKAFSSVFDGNITVMIVAVVLMIFGSGEMLSFGYSLLTGSIFNFIFGITASRLMIRSLSQFNFLRKPWLFGARKNKKELKVIHFYKNRVKSYIISGVLVLIGVVCIFVNGLNLDIKFQGGAIIKYTYAGEVDTEQIENIVVDTLGRNCDVQLTTDLATQTEKFVLNLAGKEGLSSQDQDRLNTALVEAFPDNQLALSDAEIVEPFIGRKFAEDSVKAIIIASILIILYIWYSFRKVSGLSAGTAGLFALVHDVILVFFTFIVFKMAVNDSFIAAALSILGFSINDTIVIFDRIRENKKFYGGKLSIEEIVDKSITQSLTRSINTSICTLASMVIVFIFAQVKDVQSIITFALPMVIGIVSGCYSSICLAGPIWVSWQKRKEKKALAKKSK